MGRQLQHEEEMHTVAVRLPAEMIAQVAAYHLRLKGTNPAFRIERGDAIRDLLLKALALVGSATDDQDDQREALTPRPRKKAPAAKG